MVISALNESGKPVDWWFMYKVPQLSPGANSDSSTGYEYVYFDPTLPKVDKSPNRIDKDGGALNYTLDAVFKKPSASMGWILYNDEKPEGVKGRDDGNLGHTKGVLAFDTATKTGYWLLHSWPKFAEPGATAEPTPRYGQTYLCVSMTLDSLRKLAAQMATHQEPQTYLCRTADLPKTDSLYALSQPLTPNPPPGSDVLDLKTRGGQPFKVIAKNREWAQDFWNGLVGPTLKEDMDVDTWIRGPIPPIADTDGIHKTFDIKYINLGSLGAHWAWPETHDHAKWGITTHSDWVCVGDINRMISQRKRGGGAIALQNEILWKALSRTTLLLAPPGYSRDEARDLIHATHVEKKSPAKPKAVRRPTAKVANGRRNRSGTL